MESSAKLSTSRTLYFSAYEIYGAFASAENLASWWGPNGFTNSFKEFDFRPGGKWDFTMHGPDGKSYENNSYFVDLQPAKRVVIRHDCPPLFTLTVELESHEKGTRVLWDQEFDDEETANAVKARVGSANEENLDRLTLALKRGASAV